MSNIGISMKDNNKKTVIKSQTTNKKINPNISKECSWNHLNNNKSSFDHQDQEDYNMINAFSWPPRSYTCSFCKREFRSAQALGGHMNVHRKDRARLRQSPPPPRDLIHQYGRYGSSTYNNTTTFLNLNLNHNPNPNPNFSPSNLISPLCSMSHSKPPISSTLLPSPYSAHDNNDIESKKWPWSTSTTTIPHVEYGISTDHHIQYHVDHQLDHHDDEYSLMINVKGRDKNMSLCGAGSGGLIHEGLAGKVYHCKGLNKKMSETTTSVRLDLEIGLDCDHNSEIGRDFLDLELRLGYSN